MYPAITLVSIGWRVVCCREWCDELLSCPEFCDHGFDAVFVGPGALGHGLASETGGGEPTDEASLEKQEKDEHRCDHDHTGRCDERVVLSETLLKTVKRCRRWQQIRVLDECHGKQELVVGKESCHERNCQEAGKSIREHHSEELAEFVRTIHTGSFLGFFRHCQHECSKKQSGNP